MPVDPLPRTATSIDCEAWPERVAIVSPHLDDAVLSLGAAIRAATRLGRRVDVITVLAGDPASAAPGDESIRRAGFDTAGQAARARRLEDEIACRTLDAHPIWLPFADNSNEPQPADEDIVAALERRLHGYDAVLIPGCPLDHPHHLSISHLTLEAVAPGTRLGLYVEQPYMAWRSLSRAGRVPGEALRRQALERLGLDVRPEARWMPQPGAVNDRLAKFRASGSYKSQIRVLRKLPRTRVGLYETLSGGESVLWCRLTSPDAA